ncbi:MAG TPA: serine/threonine-protein kinase [Casimicrobiaceae bacterium]|nr:serine/threonine-protein kinase [Casimicrobiaceae bacterium]
MISQLGKYEIRRELARGAMGVVYEGYDPLIKRKVALKTIRPDQLDGERSGDLLARFRREAQAAGRLNHPNIVAIYEFDEDAGTAFIAMEFVDGRELKECFAANERFRMADIERIMTSILDALDYSHRQGVVHRDIKPANIFVLADGSVKVADFGIAHIESSNLTQVGSVVGTPNYMSPEQIMGLPVDGRTDLFAAGVILYQFLTGERPFAGSTTTTMQKVLKEEPLPPSTLNVQLPHAIDAVIRKALAKRPEDRYASARDFAQALRTAIRATEPVRHDADATMPNLAAPPAPAVAIAGVPAATTTPHTAPASAVPPPAAPPPAAPPPAAASIGAPVARAPRASQRAATGIVAGIAVIGIVALPATWWLFPRATADPAQAKAAPVAVVATPIGTPAAPAPVAAATPGPVAAPATAVPVTATPPATLTAGTPIAVQPGKLLVTAVGLADPGNARYANDPSLLQADVRADARSQLVAKTLMLMLDRESFASNYELLQSRVLSHSETFVSDAVQQSAAQVGKDGLMSMTTQAVVDVDAIRHALDRMTRDDRVQLIRASGDPRIAVRIDVRDEGAPAATAMASPVAENVLKERIASFGFRTWSEASGATGAGDADFVVSGAASVRRLSTRLAASGLVITKYALASWTVKCTDKATGEEIYFNTTLPRAPGSYASEEAALRAIGTGVADAFSRDFFLTHVPVRGHRAALVVAGLSDDIAQALLARELQTLPGVIDARAGPPANPRTYDVEIARGGSETIVRDILRPLNAKLGEACFSAGATEGARVAVALDPRCAEGLRARLETNPPAGLYDAPAARRKAIVTNPETLRKLMV